MNYELIIDNVRRQVGFAQRAEAERAVAEFIEILGQLLDPRAEVVLASRLPLEMRAVLGPEDVEVFDRDAFVERLSAHTQLDRSIAERIVIVAARELAAALDGEALAELDRCLPPSVAELLRPATRVGDEGARPPGS